jgi:hypothetical protein
MRLAALALALATLAGGCVIRETRPRATVVATAQPDLVEVSPGVWVIADYDEPIFYSDGFYWWYVDGGWYRSTVYTGGWVYVSAPPVVIVRIGEPHHYRHYRPTGYVVRHRPVPVHKVTRPKVRDHRDARPRTRDDRPRNRDHR